MRKRYFLGILFLSVLFWIFFFPQSNNKSKPESFSSQGESSPQSKEQLKEVSSASTLTTLKPQVKTNLIDIINMAMENRLCTEGGTEFLTESFTFKNDDFRKKTLLKSLYKASGNETPDPCTLALIVKDRIQSIRWAQRGDSIACKTIHALLLTDQMQFKTSPQKASLIEMNEGLEILKDLQRVYPENGFFAFFSLYPLSLLEKETQLLQNLSFFLSAKYFEDPTVETRAHVRELGQMNGTSFVISTEIYSSIDLPSYREASQVAQDLLKKSTSTVALAWAEGWLKSIEMLISVNAQEPFASTQQIATFKEMARSVLQNENSDLQQHEIFQKKSWINLFRKFTGLEQSEWIYTSTACSEVHAHANQSVNPFFQKFSQIKSDTKMATIYSN